MIVVTGAGGFIGGALVRYFHEKGFSRIRGADKKPLPEWYQRVPGVECLTMDLSNEDNCQRVCEDAVEVFAVRQIPRLVDLERAVLEALDDAFVN